MNTNTANAARQRTRWPLVIVLGLLAATALWFVQHALHYYSDFSLASYGEYYWARRLVLVPHLFGGLLALSAGIVQLWLGLTNRIGNLHRNLGKVYVTGVSSEASAGFTSRSTFPRGISRMRWDFSFCASPGSRTLAWPCGASASGRSSSTASG